MLKYLFRFVDDFDVCFVFFDVVHFVRAENMKTVKTDRDAKTINNDNSHMVWNMVLSRKFGQKTYLC